MDADFAIVDINSEWVMQREDVLSSAGYSIYEGCKFKGKVLHTIVRGQFVIEHGMLVEGAVGTGRYQHRRLLGK